MHDALKLSQVLSDFSEPLPHGNDDVNEGTYDTSTEGTEMADIETARGGIEDRMPSSSLTVYQVAI